MGWRVLAQEVLEGDPHDGGGDGRLHDAGGNGHHSQHGEGEGDAVGNGEGGDDLEERQEGSPAKQEGGEEEQVIVAGEDVLDAELEESRLRGAAGASSHRDPALARLGREGELPRLAARLHLGQGVVIGTEHVEDIVLHHEIPHRAPAREVDLHREAGGVDGRGRHLARTRLAAGAVGAENDRAGAARRGACPGSAGCPPGRAGASRPDPTAGRRSGRVSV